MATRMVWAPNKWSTTFVKHCPDVHLSYVTCGQKVMRQTFCCLYRKRPKQNHSKCTNTWPHYPSPKPMWNNRISTMHVTEIFNYAIAIGKQILHDICLNKIFYVSEVSVYWSRVWREVRSVSQCVLSARRSASSSSRVQLLLILVVSLSHWGWRVQGHTVSTDTVSIIL